MRGIIIFLLGLLSFGTLRADTYTIAFDPTWYPLTLYNRGPDLTLYVTKLTHEISEIQKANFQLLQSDPFTLMVGLERGRYMGVYSSLEPTVQNLDLYDFSDPLLTLGPVLIVRKGALERSLNGFGAARVGIFSEDNSILIAQRYPLLFITTYSSIPDALASLAQGDEDALLMPYLAAEPLVRNFYSEELVIPGDALGPTAIRLVTIKGQNRSMLQLFGRGLKAVKKESSFSSTDFLLSN